jgi:hypothetical protein
MYKLYFEISSDYCIWRILLLRNYSQSKESVENEKKRTVPLHAMEAPGERKCIAPTHS